MTEHTLQLECIAQFRNDYERFGKGTIVPVVNELAAKRRDIVIKKGASDLIVFFKFKTLFVELKVDRNGQSEDQKDFQKLVEKLGFKYYVIRSLNDFQNLLQQEQPCV